MLQWIELGCMIFVVVVLYAVAKQIDKQVEILERIEARLALIKPLASELDILDEIEEQAHPGARIGAMLRGPLGQ
jgi:hypothetical protein